jgi:hypothetical protein
VRDEDARLVGLTNPSILDALVAAIADAVALRFVSAGASESPWMTRLEASEYLRLPVSRLEKDRRVPCHKDGGRVLYHRDELNEYVLGLGRAA